MPERHFSDLGISLLLLFSAALWGAYWFPLRMLESQGLTQSWGVAFMNACPLLVLLPYCLIKRKAQSSNWHLALLIGFLMGLGFGFYAIGLVISSVIRVTMLFYLIPVWSTLIGIFWLQEKPTRGRILAIFLGLAGVYLLVGSNEKQAIPLNFGDLLALLSGVFCAFGAACIKRWPETPTVAITTIQLTVSALASIFLGGVIFASKPPDLVQLAGAFPMTFIASTLVLLPATFIIFRAAKFLYPGRIGILMMTEILVAVVSASLLLPDEILHPMQWFGGLGIIGACFCEILASRKKQ